MSTTNALRGMYDLLPEQTPLWHYLEDNVKRIFNQYSYQEIRTPIVEKTELFARSIGDATDVVEKEMYTFADRNDESISLRPEGTASCVRAVLEHGLLYNQTPRVWYYGPMFRYERPQKGRQRQFNQFGAEVYGLASPDIDAELIIMTARLWKNLGIDSMVTLQLNTLGTLDARTAYREDLVIYLQQHFHQLDEDSQRRLHKNPLRILDSKDAGTQKVLEGAPDFLVYLDAESADHFAQVQHYLKVAGIKYEINPRLVRGLDYYCKTVFEWVTDHLGAQGTVCGGGRYDGLVKQMGGADTPGIGWAMGVERLILLLQKVQHLPNSLAQQVNVYFVCLGEEAQKCCLNLAENLRSSSPEIKVYWHCGGGSLKSQLKKADKSGADIAVIVGENEVADKTVQIKPLRGQNQQVLATQDRLNTEVMALLNTI